MNRKSLFVIALVVLLLAPLYIWVIQPTYERYQIAGKAEAYFNEMPVYPGATPVEKSLSFYSIGYGYTYKVSDDPETVLKYYISNVKDWKFDKRIDTSNTKSEGFVRNDSDLKVTVMVWKSGSPTLSNPPYDLTVSVYKP